MNLDVQLKDYQIEKACVVLGAGGFSVTRNQVAAMTPRELASNLSNATGCKRKTVLELLECVTDVEFED
jgi:hypothetical protein